MRWACQKLMNTMFTVVHHAITLNPAAFSAEECPNFQLYSNSEFLGYDLAEPFPVQCLERSFITLSQSEGV